MVLRPDEVEWFAPQSGHNGLLSSIADRDKFPRLPNSLFYLRQVLEDETSQAKDIALVSRKDPVTAAGILLIANRMRQSRGQSIDSLEHAVTYIGRDMVKLIALTSALGTFKFMTLSFSAIQFWNEAFLTAAVCEAMAPSLAPRISPDEAYIAGALCNIGKVVNAIYVPQLVDQIAERTTSESGQNWESIERGVTAFSHTKSGEFAAAEWGLPAFVIDAIREHHDLPKFGVDRSQGLTLTELVSFCNQLAHAATKKLYRIDRDIFNSYTAICHFTKNDVKVTLKDLQSAISDAKEVARQVTSLS
jgi:HD-like signal output (HDOD) protein